MPELRAINPVKTALDRTIKLLFEPFDAWLWVKLIIITFFTGGGSQFFNPLSYSRYTSGNSEPLTSESINNFITYLTSNPLIVALIVAVIILVILISLFFSYLRGVFSFVLVDAITSGHVQIRKSFADNMHRGFKVFLFNILISIISLAVLVLLGGAALLSVLLLINSSQQAGASGILPMIAAFGIIIITVILLLVFSLITGLVVEFFYDFALPLMLFKNMELKESVRHVFGLVKAEPVEFIVYLILRWTLQTVAGLLMLIISLLILAISFAIGIFIAFLAIAAANVSIWLIILFVPVFLIGLILLFAILMLISLPINIYFRYYSLDFLRSFDASYVQYTGRFAPSEPSEGRTA